MFFILSIKLPIAKKYVLLLETVFISHLFVSPFTTNFILFCTLWTSWAWRWLKLTDKRVQMKNKIKIYSSLVCIYSNCLFPQSDLSKRLRSFTCFSADETTVESKTAADQTLYSSIYIKPKSTGALREWEVDNAYCLLYKKRHLKRNARVNTLLTCCLFLTRLSINR